MFSVDFEPEADVNHNTLLKYKGRTPRFMVCSYKKLVYKKLSSGMFSVPSFFDLFTPPGNKLFSTSVPSWIAGGDCWKGGGGLFSNRYFSKNFLRDINITSLYLYHREGGKEG